MGRKRNEDTYFKRVEDIEDFEDEVMFAAAPDGKGSGGHFGQFLELVRGFLPGKDEWQAKTVLENQDQAVSMAQVRMLARLYEEELSDTVLEVLVSGVEDVEKYRTSVGGQSREEITNIMRAGLGDDPGEIESARGLLGALGEGFDKDDD